MPRQTNFSRCAVKEIRFVNYYKPLSEEAMIWSTEEPEDTDEYDLKMSAALHCPRSKGTVSSDLESSGLETVQSLEQLALAAVCGGCPFPRMPRAKVDRIVAEELKAEALRIRAEAELEAAKQEYQRVIALGMEALESTHDQDAGPEPE